MLKNSWWSTPSDGNTAAWQLTQQTKRGQGTSSRTVSNCINTASNSWAQAVSFHQRDRLENQTFSSYRRGVGRGEEAEKGDFKFLPFSSLFLAFPRLEQVSSSAWGESEDSGDARLSCSRKGGFVELRMRFTLQLGKGFGAGGSDAGWQRSSPGSPSLHRASILALNPPPFCFSNCSEVFFLLEKQGAGCKHIPVPVQMCFACTSLRANALPTSPDKSLHSLARHLQPATARPRPALPTHLSLLTRSLLGLCYSSPAFSIEVVSHLTWDSSPTVLICSIQATVTMQKKSCLKKDTEKFPADASNHAR